MSQMSSQNQKSTAIQSFFSKCMVLESICAIGYNAGLWNYCQAVYFTYWINDLVCSFIERFIYPLIDINYYTYFFTWFSSISLGSVVIPPITYRIKYPL